METIQTKCCNKCGVEKSFDLYYKQTKSKDGYQHTCKLCMADFFKKNHIKRVEKNPNYLKESYQKEKNSEKRKLREIRFKENNPNYEKKGSEQFEKIKLRNKKRYENDIFYKLKQNVRNTILRGLETEKSKLTEQILGCSIQELKQHLENQFSEGMSWENHSRDGWHIDHKFPLAKASSEEEIYKLNHYTNLQPLWWYDNLRKSDKLPEEMFNA